MISSVLVCSLVDFEGGCGDLVVVHIIWIAIDMSVKLCMYVHACTVGCQSCDDQSSCSLH